MTLPLSSSCIESSSAMIPIASVEGNDDLLINIFEFLDVIALVQKKSICSRWQRLCTRTIDEKLHEGQKKPFMNNEELKTTIDKYLDHNTNTIDNRRRVERNAEQIASTYGWPINNWDVSQIENFTQLFRDRRTFDEDISGWDVSNGKYFHSMFQGAEKFNRDISTWNITSKAECMKCMFHGATMFNPRSLSQWDTSNVKSMSGMFAEADAFDADISCWNTTSVKGMTLMFSGATSFNQNISNWNTSNVQCMLRMFHNASSFNQNIRSWNTDNVWLMDGMLDGATSFECQKHAPMLDIHTMRCPDVTRSSDNPNKRIVYIYCDN